MSQPTLSPFRRIASLAYGLAVYAVFQGVFIYLIGFIVGLPFLPKTIDTGAPTPLAEGLAINLGLILLWGVAHSTMARPWFKRRWTKLIPAEVERATFVLQTCLLFALMFWQWRPLPDLVWKLELPALRYAAWGLCAAGWLLMLVATFQIHHFELFGLAQVWHSFRKSRMLRGAFRQPLLYRLVRHPIMTGALLGIWVTPTMSVGHLAFALAFTVYVLIGTRLEEKDLVERFGDGYRKYQRTTPAFFPRPLAPRAQPSPEPAASAA